MKSFFTILSLTLSLATGLKAQGNLQFNQVILLEPSFTVANVCCTQYSPVQTVVVPAGKVWKIESASIGFTYTVSSVNHRLDTPDGTIFLNDKILYSAATTTSRATSVFPMWLPPGSYSVSMRLNNIAYGSTYSNQTCKGMISIMEFNVVP